MVCTIIWQLYTRKPLQQFRKMQIRRTIFRPRNYLRMRFGSYTLLGSVGTVFRQTRVICYVKRSFSCNWPEQNFAAFLKHPLRAMHS